MLSLIHILVAFAEGHVGKLGGEGGMAAVIGPVGIEYADLGHGWIAFFFATEVVLDMQEVFEGHGKAEGIIQGF